MEVRDHDPGDFCRVDAACLHVVEEFAGSGLHLATRAGIEEHKIAAGVYEQRCERDRDKLVRQPSRLQRTLHIVQAGVFYEGRIVWLLPDAVIDGGALECTDLVFVE